MRSFIAVVLALCVIGASSSAVLAQQHTTKAVPPAIKAAFEKKYPNAVIKNIDKEKTNGTMMYEVESIDGKTRRDFLYYEDGTVYEIEETIEPAALPEAITKDIAKEYPKGKIVTAEKITRGNVTEYELTVKSGKKSYEVKFDAAGAKIAKKAETEEKK